MAVINDNDRDSLHVLPLCIIPLETAVLQRTRMIKNTHLDSVIELFEGKETGSGQIKIEALGMAFENVPYADVITLQKLSRLNSYDVYSLRLLLRKQGIDVDEGDLQLSEVKQNELTHHMRQFTRPLITHIYGDEQTISDYADAIALLSHPDVRRAKQNLVQLSERLGIRLDQVPKFLEDYGDIFLSISYYKQCLGSIAPTLADFKESVDRIGENRVLQQDRNLIDNCTRIRDLLSDLAQSTQQRLNTFDYGSRNMWAEIDAARFHKFRDLVQNSHTKLGSVLCALSIKMDAWQQEFPDPEFGGPMKRAEFIITEMQQGLGRFRRKRFGSLDRR